MREARGRRSKEKERILFGVLSSRTCVPSLSRYSPPRGLRKMRSIPLCFGLLDRNGAERSQARAEKGDSKMRAARSMGSLLLSLLPIVVHGAPVSAIVAAFARCFFLLYSRPLGREDEVSSRRKRERERWSVSCLTCFFVFEVLFEECEPDEQVFPPHSSLCFSRLSLPSTFCISLWEPGPSKTPVEDQKTHQQQCLTRKCRGFFKVIV